jgi:C-terminal processing protease CtpA/Prc
MFPGYKQVLAVGILLDANGIRQGDPNYSNQVVMPGDRLVRIESRPVNVLERLEWWAGSDKEMLEFLNGPEGTEVRVQLERNHDGKTYEVVLKRHVPAVPSKTVAQGSNS